ncbi:acetyl-CoA carboxylase biotin carboxyl carrier protein [soil metagenome]
MSDTPTEAQAEDNIQRVRHLVRLMHRFDLSEIVVIDDQAKIRLRRGGSVPGAAPAPVAPVVAAPASTPASPISAPSAVEPASGVFIESPMVGTFYASPAPDAPPFLSVGSTVRPESTVCIIEAMKVFTEIPAGVSGTIVEILVKDKQSVEFGQPLFRVEPT